MLTSNKKSRFISTLCSYCSENYGVPEFKEHLLTDEELECCQCGQKYSIKEVQGNGFKGYYILELIQRGRGGRKEQIPS